MYRFTLILVCFLCINHVDAQIIVKQATPRTTLLYDESTTPVTKTQVAPRASKNARYQPKIVRCINMEQYEQRLEAQDPTRKARRETAVKAMNRWLNNRNADRLAATETEYTIPIVFHVLWNSSNTNEKISLSQIQSQITVLNQDYNRQNADTVHTPGAFKPVAANFHITFCLAHRDLNGNWTNGVIYKETSTTSFSDANNAAKYPSLGGDTIWNPNKYMNVWICNLSGGLLGYSEFPTMPLDNTFGSVINYQAVGDVGYLPYSQYNMGRTLTHEIGHLLNLHHPWGDDGGLCPGSGGTDDGCADTPPEGNNKSGDGYGSGSGPTFGNPPFPYTDNCSTTSPGIMIENFMEYTDDVCMNLFTQDQYNIALASLNGPLAQLTASNTCTPLAIDEVVFKNSINIYPNPSATGRFTIAMELTNFTHINIQVYNVMGQKVGEWNSDNANSYTLDLSNQPDGLYFARVSNSTFSVVKRIMIYR